MCNYFSFSGDCHTFSKRDNLLIQIRVKSLLKPVCPVEVAVIKSCEELKQLCKTILIGYTQCQVSSKTEIKCNIRGEIFLLIKYVPVFSL